MNKKRFWRLLFLPILMLSLCFTCFSSITVAAPVEETPLVRNETSTKSVYPFPWNKPGPTSPYLQSASPQAGGMLGHPLRKMDAVIEEAIDSKLTSGAVVLVARKGKIVKHQAYGYAAQYKDDQFTPLENPVRMKRDTIFDLASITKLFTTTAAMILYEEGKFDLDDPVATYIPEFAQNGKEKVTIRQLMTHTSGFAAGIPLYNMGNSREERLQILFAHPLDHEPGSTYIYSDLNMIVLGALIERLTNERLDHFITKRITTPLGMHDTMYNPPQRLKPRIAATEYQTRVPRGLVWGEVHDEKAWALDGIAGHAGLFSTAKDLAIFGHMMLQEGKYGNKRILKPETVRLMMKNFTPQFPGDDHGLGWELNQGWYMDAFTEPDTMGHTGFTGTSLVISPQNKAILILLTNRVHPSRNMGTINPLRREVARMAADAIPAPLPDKKGVWFAGYGDQQDATLQATLPTQGNKKLSFTTWYRTESPGDTGRIEISETGKSWQKVDEPIVGNSEGWQQYEIPLPKQARFVRFRYQTDELINGRGWYVKDPTITLENGKKLPISWKSDQHWEIRNW